MLKFKVSLLMCLLVSCEKPAPITHEFKQPIPETNPTLAASQLALAKSHLAAEAPDKAVPYLEAAIRNGGSATTEKLLREILVTARFTVPVARFTHPYPVLTFVRSETSLFAAIAGPHPTVVRWELGEDQQAAAVLFPAGKHNISHLSVSPSGKHLLVHRGETNLLCLAETLKPITNLGTFPLYLDPENLQPFSENSLLLAHPTANDRTLTWHIRDSATGEILRSESSPLYPKPQFSHFQETTLLVELKDRTRIEIPVVGEITKSRPSGNSGIVRPRIVPPPQTTITTHEGNSINFARIISIHPSLLPSITPSLLPAITGYRLNPATQTLEKVPTPERLEILSKTFPGIPPTFTIHTSETAVFTRLAAAFPDEFPDLTATARADAKILEETFAKGDPAAITAAIRALPPSGLPTATALFLSLKSENPEYIRETLAIAKDVPTPLLNRDIPLPENYRNEQDWLGYESPDFSEIFSRREAETITLIGELQLPENPTEEDIQDFVAHLLAPETQEQLPSKTLALSAITAARSLSRDESQATSALKLVALAERLGTPQAEILRTKATALTTLGEFEDAHRAWIALITDLPEADHLPSDYSEAAHTAFETSAPDQAAEILRTGLFRFPNDVALAIRAGWIALLTDHPEQAADYLTRATRLGLPGDEVENTTALLAIAHTQLGDPDTAQGFLEQLTAINPAWAEPATIEKLPWPEPFKASLRQLTW